MTLQVAKVIMLGDTGVGKTSIVSRGFNDSFDPNDNIDPTIGSEFFEKIFPIARKESSVKFQVWDTAGQEQFRSITPMYLRDSVIAILVFDVTKKSSIDALNYYIKVIRDKQPNCFIAVVGNKIDLKDERQVSYQEGSQYAESIGSNFYVETSAYTGEGVSTLFYSLAQQEIVFPEISEALPIQEKGNDKRCC